MRLLIGASLIIALILLGICIHRTYKEQHKLAATVRKILIAGFVIVFVNTVSLLAQNETVSLASHCIYFATADWMLYFLFRFSIDYIGNDFNKFVKRKAMLLLLGADTASVLLNFVFHHLFRMEAMTVMGDGHFFKPVNTPFFFIHYAIILMLVTFCLISLFYGAVKAPVFYRKKYLLIAIILVVIVIANFLLMSSPIDYSVMGYVVEGICIYYCAMVYTPQRLLSKTLFKVTEDMSVGLYVMDNEGGKLYSNASADNLFCSEPPVVLDDDVTLEDWCRSRYLDSDEEFITELTFKRNDEDIILNIQLQRMVDEKKILQGGYFTIQDRTEEYEKLKKDIHLATHDTLTDLYNREHFYDKCENYIAAHPDDTLYIVCTDIKDFKMINDFFGTKIGDRVLQSFAEMLRSRIKGAEVYGRLGNDIFGMLMQKENFDEDSFIRESKDAFASCINKSNAFPTINYVGVYEIADRSLPISVMCDRARMAIHSIKGDYSKRTAYYDSALRDNILYEQELISELNSAISEDQFKMFLQPQISADGKLLGAEALIRWFHPVRGQIMPSDFIPVFEKNGLISEVDKYIWELACKLLRKWKDQGRDELYISVNISPRDFYFLNIYQIFTELIEKYDIPASAIKLEITETAIVMDFQRQIELITKLRQNGFVVEMDDFGSGYSSLNMLKDLHVDVLKIDMAFLKKAEDEERSKKILQMIITLSKQLDMPVITEGVETEEQVKALTEMGCDIFQGYYFAKPMAIEDFEKLYKEHNK